VFVLTEVAAPLGGMESTSKSFPFFIFIFQEIVSNPIFVGDQVSISEKAFTLRQQHSPQIS
jgi:hypothetical protein